MAKYQTLDPFKPAQPEIPGVPASDESMNSPQASVEPLQATSALEPARDGGELPPDMKLAWVGIALAGFLTMLFFVFGYKGALRKSGGLEAPTKAVAATPTVSEPSGTPAANADSAVGPGVVANAAQLAKPWSARRFLFRDPVTLKETPALVVRLPGGTLWGFSLREPYGTCELQYVTDLGKLQRDYELTATHPMVADPCNNSVFDLARYGNAPAGLVRGDVVKGPALRPPMGIEIRTKGDAVIAVRSEQ